MTNMTPEQRKRGQQSYAALVALGNAKGRHSAEYQRALAAHAALVREHLRAMMCAAKGAQS